MSFCLDSYATTSITKNGNYKRSMRNRLHQNKRQNRKKHAHNSIEGRKKQTKQRNFRMMKVDEWKHHIGSDAGQELEKRANEWAIARKRASVQAKGRKRTSKRAKGRKRRSKRASERAKEKNDRKNKGKRLNEERIVSVSFRTRKIERKNGDSSLNLGNFFDLAALIWIKPYANLVWLLDVVHSNGLAEWWSAWFACRSDMSNASNKPSGTFFLSLLCFSRALYLHRGSLLSNFHRRH